MDNDLLLKKRFTELSNRAYLKGFNTFSDFLNIDEISVLKSTNVDIEPILFGGYNNANRCISGFGEYIQNSDFPIVCIKISPLQQKFSDELTHRDFLGALMNLGINRCTLGDIIIKENTGYLFCLDTISNYIIDNLDKVKHTSVKCEILKNIPEFMSELPDTQQMLVSSLRIDVIIAKIYNLSRNNVNELFKREKIFINSKVTTKNSINLKTNDIVSVRGYGKFIYCGIEKETKKEKFYINLKVY